MAEARPLLVTLYLALARLAAPLYRLVHLVRCRAGKDDPARGSEKWGRSSIARPAGPVIWIHAASVGETNSVLPLIETLSYRGFFVVLTTVTRTSAELAEARLPDRALHQFVPFDSPGFVRAFLDHWRPDMAMTVESEIWPGVFVAIHERQIPFILINGRMSDRSFKGWLRLREAAAYLFGCLDIALAQTPADAERLKKLGCRDVICPGNLKFDARPKDADQTQVDRLKAAIGGRPVWLAALTHPGEDEIVLRAHRAILDRRPDCLLILVPRHPVRADAIEETIEAQGFSLARRSRKQLPEAGTQVYLGDTLGEMALFYRLAPIAFLGGSYVDVGGHNPLEAASFGAAILSGPKVANAHAIYKSLWAGEAAKRVEDPAMLAEAVLSLQTGDEERERQVAQAAAIVESGRGALKQTLEYLDPLVAGALRTSGGGVAG